MLTGIKLYNYTTFINETIFDFNATNYKILEKTNVGSNRVLKGAIFVGENASGKTQVLDSIILLLNLLLDNVEQNFLLKKSLYTTTSKYSLEYEFNVDNNIVNYKITFDGNNISSEKLFINSDLKLERINTSGTTYFGEEKDNNDINLNLSLLKLEYYNTRFNNDVILNKLFDYLKNSIYINCLNKNIKSYNPTKSVEQFIGKYAQHNNEKNLNKLLENIGYNSEVVFKKKKNDTFSTDETEVGLRKVGTNVFMPMYRESAGNQALMNVILPFSYATKNNCMLIIDEFSSGLHNDLMEALIKYFYNNSNDSQLFLTSHSTNILDTFVVRPDQIYSFRFDAKKGTLINRFSNENPRESQNIEKMYLNGVFDGMPNYNKEFKN